MLGFTFGCGEDWPGSSEHGALMMLATGGGSHGEKWLPSQQNTQPTFFLDCHVFAEKEGTAPPSLLSSKRTEAEAWASLLARRVSFPGPHVQKQHR
jgi:hypothetical protein